MANRGTNLSRRWVLAALGAGAAQGALANAPLQAPRPAPRPAGLQNAAAPDAAALIAKARLSGKIGYAVADARTGEILEAKNPLLGLPPASVTKALTALYGLEALGPAYRFTTQVIATGPVSGGRLDGDLVLVGGGDPTLDTDMLADLAAQLHAAGLREVAGRFRYYAGALPSVAAIDPGQPPHVGYNPAICGLNLNFNRVHFEWRRGSGGYAVTMDARAQRYRPEVSVARMQVVNRAAPVYTYSSKGGVDEWTVARGALGKGGARWLPVRRPALYTAEVFQTLARAHGIALPRPEAADRLPGGTALARHASAPLPDILRDMLKYSTNMTAEAVGLTATRARSLPALSLDASGDAMAGWMETRLGAHKARFVDHSGLGDASRLSAAEMVRALAQVGPDGPLRPLLKTIALRDDQGRPMRAHPVEIRAKTGTLNFVSALAGYIRAPSGPDLAFAIFTADPARRASLVPAERERPEGGRAWVGRARTLQSDLIKRWLALYG
ncbi:D-alanyl-D-alanine carboxypeptidase/D-alanyl-D-alanine-endopeptidase (penicillin-binding protein 4) [Rhodovulum iodosum]|uniref:D-alanyl-D-alanine carboxypeptidase/D-alanyl-D-alanine-endopeptidase (Penicillin-binding protein 4) n=1 Tax=Rhodovulum iodosum TaxID=68291 RepID=A0ABV3XWZ6_9RHOB|nr:D-alanyl-D-alanine carboxypeptidase/D-alanyl-D-alanine-endopeptidase [Rhodovulum robiginosum]RSK34071.1 D-alanyl-D-alanine carboxypeptidase/D-alanyl-D-alanine-endopeptidase [Rhodovulum robiginosum]